MMVRREALHRMAQGSVRQGCCDTLGVDARSMSMCGSDCARLLRWDPEGQCVGRDIKGEYGPVLPNCGVVSKSRET